MLPTKCPMAATTTSQFTNILTCLLISLSRIYAILTSNSQQNNHSSFRRCVASLQSVWLYLWILSPKHLLEFQTDTWNNQHWTTQYQLVCHRLPFRDLLSVDILCSVRYKNILLHILLESKSAYMYRARKVSFKDTLVIDAQQRKPSSYRVVSLVLWQQCDYPPPSVKQPRRIYLSKFANVEVLSAILNDVTYPSWYPEKLENKEA